MYRIVSVKELNPKTKMFEVLAPDIAVKVEPGQFVIVIISEKGERIPLTICDYDREKGTIFFISCILLFSPMNATSSGI